MSVKDLRGDQEDVYRPSAQLGSSGFQGLGFREAQGIGFRV